MQCFNPNATSINHGITIRRTRMIEEPCLIPLNRRVHHHVIINGKQIRVMPLALHVWVPRLRCGRRQSLTRILNESHTGRDRPRGKPTQPLDS